MINLGTRTFSDIYHLATLAPSGVWRAVIQCAPRRGYQSRANAQISCFPRNLFFVVVIRYVVASNVAFVFVLLIFTFNLYHFYHIFNRLFEMS